MLRRWQGIVNHAKSQEPARSIHDYRKNMAQMEKAFAGRRPYRNSGSLEGPVELLLFLLGFFLGCHGVRPPNRIKLPGPADR